MKKTTMALFLALNVVIASFFGTLASTSIQENTVEEMATDARVVQVASVLSTGDALDQLLTIPEVVEINSDSVVEIMTEVVTTHGRLGQYVSEGAGSGVIVSEDGYIVTNNHVIDGASKITVRLTNGSEYIATLVGRDQQTDLAVVKISDSSVAFNAVVFGNSDTLKVGELAIAMGNPLGKLGGTVTEGIISALDRSIDIDGEVMTLLQTSAAINPGNSGGGLFNAYGELIGIVNAKTSGTGIEGLGFAIPINTAAEVIEDIIANGYVLGRVDIGVTLIDIEDQMTALRYRLSSTGVYVQNVSQSTSGLQIGDRIVSVNDASIRSSQGFKEVIATYKAGDIIRITIERNRQLMDITIELQQYKG